jgi:antirestriction protein ArdC
MRTDVYEKITNQIVSELEKGVRPWHQPWKAEHAAGRITRPLRGNGVPYQGINVLMLWSAAIEKGYAAPIWMTFKQSLELKAHVRKGEQGSLVVYADKIIRTETDERTGEESEHAIPFMKGYIVFNVEQIEGLPDHYYGKPEVRTDSVRRIAHAEVFLAATGANVIHGGSRACYIPSTDNIHMPCIDFFRDAESYYATRAHETCHYADLGIAHRPHAEHAAYIASWIEILSDDPRAIFTAASKAQAAADWMHAQQSRQMLTGDSVDNAVPLAQPDQAMHRSDLLREDNRANAHGGATTKAVDYILTLPAADDGPARP